MVVVSRPLNVAAGVFAPGHLGELTRYLPFELVDDVLAATRTVQRRLRVLPSRTGVYFVLALALFPRLGYARVWSKLCAGLHGTVGGGVSSEVPAASSVAHGPVVTMPSEKALRDLRRRLGPAPLKALFDIVAGPVGQPRTPGVCFAGLRTVAFDGLNSLKVPDSVRNRGWLGRIRYHHGWGGYPNLRLLCLVETGTRALLGAVIGDGARPGERDETTLARRLLALLRPGMLVLLDRGFDKNPFFAAIDATGAALLARIRSNRVPVVEHLLPDGSYRSHLDGLAVRVIEAVIDLRSDDGAYARDRYQLVTTLLDHHRFPADGLVALYHERWEIETAFYALRHTMLDQVVLRSHDRAGLLQEVWAALTLYQLLRMAMVDAVETRPGLDPDRASFTTALQTARDQLITGAGIDSDPTDPADPAGYAPRGGRNVLLGTIGQAVLATLLPARRARYSTRAVKCPTSRYYDRGDRGDDTRPARSTTITTIDITVCPPRPRRTTRAAVRYAARRARPPQTRPRPSTRRDRVTMIMATHPGRAWTPVELATQLAIPFPSMRSQLAEWARHGLLTRSSRGRYSLNTPTPPTSSTPTEDP